MTQVRRPTSTGAALAVLLLLGVLVSIAGSLVLDIALNHVFDVWRHLGKGPTYVLEFALSFVAGLLLCLPLLFTRPQGPAVPVVAALIAVPVNVVSDLVNLVFENFYYRFFKHYEGVKVFSGFGYFFSHQDLWTRLSYLMALVAALMVAGLRVWAVGKSLQAGPAFGPQGQMYMSQGQYPNPPYGPQGQPYGPQGQPYGPQYGGPGFGAPPQAPPPMPPAPPPPS